MQNVKQWTADFIVKMIKHMQLIVRPYIYTTDHQNKRGRHINMCRNETFRFLKKKDFHIGASLLHAMSCKNEMSFSF